MTDCAICLQLLRTPVKVLDCGHSFCCRCLRQMRRQTAGPSNGNLGTMLNCPTCRRQTLLVDGRVSSLPTNFALNDLLDAERITNGNVNGEIEEGNEDDIASSLTYPDNQIIPPEPELDNSLSPRSVARILGYRARLRGYTIPVLLNAQTQTSTDVRSSGSYSLLSLPSLINTSSWPNVSSSSTTSHTTPIPMSTPSSLFSNMSRSATSSVFNISSLSSHGEFSSEGENGRSYYWICANEDCRFRNYDNHEKVCLRCFSFRRHHSTEPSSENDTTEKSVHHFNSSDSFESTNSSEMSFDSFSETCTDTTSD